MTTCPATPPTKSPQKPSAIKDHDCAQRKLIQARTIRKNGTNSRDGEKACAVQPVPKEDVPRWRTRGIRAGVRATHAGMPNEMQNRLLRSSVASNGGSNELVRGPIKTGADIVSMRRDSTLIHSPTKGTNPS